VSPSYSSGERIGIRIINKNRFPVFVRLHKINYANNCLSIPLSTTDDFLRIEGCREEEGSWETAYFDLGICRITNDATDTVELLKLLVTNANSVTQVDRLSTIVTKSFTIKAINPVSSSQTTTQQILPPLLT